MWEFRSKPQGNGEAPPELEELFEAIPELGLLYYCRWDLTAIFDTAKDRKDAERKINKLRADMNEYDLDFSAFWDTYDRWKDGILAYFDDRKTSGVVEGINNKARVITKRAYGLKTAASVWTRLTLDLNHAADVIGYSIQRIRQIATTIQCKFAACYT